MTDPLATCPACASPMQQGRTWFRGLHWSDRKVTLLHNGRLPTKNDGDITAGSQRRTGLCETCGILVMDYDRPVRDD